MQETVRKFGAGNLRFHINKTDKFKMSRLSVNFILPADKERSPITRIMLATMMRGCRKYPNILSINKRLDELYGATVVWRAMEVGERHIFKISCEMLSNKYSFPGDGINIVEEVCRVVSDILFDPLLDENGLLHAEHFESEKKLALDAIKAKINNQRAYSAEKCKELMLGDSPLGWNTEGNAEQIEKMTLREVSENIGYFFENAIVECYYFGNDDIEAIIETLGNCFKSVSRRPAAISKEYPFVGNSGDAVNNNTENMEVSQSRLNIGCTCSVIMSDPEYYAMSLFNEIFGGSSVGKLFMNVREKQSLCYYCSSSYSSATGIIMIKCGIKNENRDRAYAEIIRQLEEMKSGNFSEGEIETAKKTLISGVKQVSDSPAAIEAFGFRRLLSGVDESPEVCIERILDVTKADIISAAKKVRIDTVYFLSGNGVDEECDYE